LRCGNEKLKFTCSVSSDELSKWSSTTLARKKNGVICGRLQGPLWAHFETNTHTHIHTHTHTHS
jgi:hypothetical protein